MVSDEQRSDAIGIAGFSEYQAGLIDALKNNNE